MFKKGDANIIQPLERIITIFEEADVKDQTEVMLITNNEIANFNEGRVTELIDVLKEHSISITAVAISENLYEKNPMHFFEKMYFVNK